MARPRKGQRGPDARTRIVDAFWGMLAEGPYADITVRALASRARVNHNTIYRHFDSVEDVAKVAVSEVYSIEAARHMFELFAQPDSVDVDSLARWGLDVSFNKVILAVRSESPILMAMVTEGIKASWMQLTGMSWDTLSDEMKLELSFILGGITAT
ncbi:MAG: TetR/AcrR family transcriptional regulator, partial [Eggerthellaceae bacterium]|nr:TetR/AcrR family transcriptional regulator [Eggerthellaceae bacterium]